MNFLNKLERKFGRYAIPNLMNYIVFLYGIGFILLSFAPDIYWRYLCLDFRAVLHGQIWRLVSFLIYPAIDGLAGVSSVVGYPGAPGERPAEGQRLEHIATETFPGGVVWLRFAVKKA